TSPFFEKKGLDTKKLSQIWFDVCAVRRCNRTKNTGEHSSPLPHVFRLPVTPVGANCVRPRRTGCSARSVCALPSPHVILRSGATKNLIEGKDPSLRSG
ncbi:MAG: hypothetical protein IJC15_08625, partial [Clostridia bacterium]|nr:hypothetical protein [Clostridia bacterium]